MMIEQISEPSQKAEMGKHTDHIRADGGRIRGAGSDFMPVRDAGSLSRRSFVATAAGLTLAAAPYPRATPFNPLVTLEQTSGGRLGVFMLDTRNGRTFGHHADEHFLMCSTFKLILVASILQAADQGREQLDRMVYYSSADISDFYAPVTRAHLAEGRLPIETLCAAAVQASDNGAANLLLPRAGGPKGFTRFARSIGDHVTRLDRVEPFLNRPNGELDTTTARAMLGSARKLLLGEVLKPVSRQRLIHWMVTCETGNTRIRAGLPSSWTVGDKTGTGNTLANDVTIAWPPGRPPILIASYLDAPKLESSARDAVLKQVGQIAASWYGI